MKKFSLIGLVLILAFMCSQVFADVITTRKLNPQNAGQTTQTQTTTQQKTMSNNQSSNNKLANKVKNCTPYSESAAYDVSGMNFVFDIKILGWVNNKCRMDFTGNTAGISSSFKSLYGVDASQAEITAFAPKFRCEFSKQQLAEFGDSILEEEARKNGGKMLKDPNNLDLLSMTQNMSVQDAGLLGMIMDGKTCQLLNAGNPMDLLDSLLGF